MALSHAIILGGGCGGLLAAKALSAFFNRVSIIERHPDILRNDFNLLTIPKNIPQAAHIHVLLKQGQNIFNEIFPNILNSLPLPCSNLDWALDTEWHGPFGQYPQYSSGVRAYFLSRTLLDHTMIREIRKIKTINIAIGSAKIIFDKIKNKVIGAQISDNKIKYKLFGDLIIDARGRCSPILKSLSFAGYKIPQTKRIISAVSYASCIFQSNEALQKQIYIQIRPSIRHHGLVISPIEQKRMFVTLVTLKEAPPRTDAEFNQFLAHFRTLPIYPFFANAHAISPIATYANFTNTRSFLGSLKVWPKNLLVIGDATCVLNPVYGQGMTVAASHVSLLKNYLSRSKLKPGWEHNFQRNADALSIFPWLMATSEDQRLQESKTISFATKILQSYIDLILQKSLTHQDLHYAFLRTLHMLDSPYKLLSPRIVARAILG